MHMQVLHINANYSTSALHKVMIEHMDQSEIDSKVFVPTYDKSKSTVQCTGNVILSQCFRKWDRFFFFIKQRKIINSLLTYYDVSEFDIIHAYTLFTDGFSAMELSSKYKIPYVVAVRNTDLNIFFKKLFYLRSTGVEILKNAAAVFFLSPIYRSVIINRYVPEEYREDIFKKSYIIPNGIDDYWHENVYIRDTATIAERIKNTKTVRCIYVGGVDKNKNIELTLKALTQMNNEGWNCSLISIGNIVDRKVYEGLVKYKCFFYIGPRKKEELVEYYRKADIFVMPSHTETFGLVYAEAISQGMPVIYTRGQGFDGQFVEGEVGYSTDDRQVSELITTIKKVCSNYDVIYNNLSTKIAKYNWNLIVQQYISIYSQIIK